MRKALTRRLTCGFIVCLTCLLAGSVVVNPALGADYENIPVTRWVDPDGSKPTTYEQWKASTEDAEPFKAALVKTSSALKLFGEGTGFCVIINTTLYPLIQGSIDQYVLDLAVDGFDVEVHTISGGDPESMRAFLQTKYAEGMEGCVLIGDLPVPWFEADCFDSHAEFPCDLYYMDLNGLFIDDDLDGKFDIHSGFVVPEIWVGRLTASPLTLGGSTEVALLENYFYKNHQYRTGQAPMVDRALVYVEDDWEPWATSWSNNVGLAYDTRTLVSDEYETFAPDYESRLPLYYESILVCVHSSPTLHQFTNPIPQYSYTYNSEIKSIDPAAYFYNLFACSNARYIEANYMAGWYIFCQSYGLVSIGSTKSGAMLDFEHFYEPFGQGKTIGKSFMDWLTAIAVDGFDSGELCWHYGMTICGDPTLTQPPQCIDSDGDGFGDPGSIGNTCPDDNCPSIYNLSQLDADSDGIGDACDDCTDTDNDGYGDPGYPVNTCADDNCPDDANPGQADHNNDQIGDRCCCMGRVGDTNGLGGDEPTISDISVMIDLLFLAGDPLVIFCFAEADVNQSGGTEPTEDDITISDISTLIDYLFLSGNPLHECQ